MFDARDVAAETTKWYESIDEKRMIAYVSIEEDCEELSKEALSLVKDGEVEIKIQYKVCSLCNGKGKHVNPSIDAHGITTEEFSQWSYEEKEEYRNGFYDVNCYRCGGRRVEPVIDKRNLSKAEKEIVNYINGCIEDERAYVRTCMMERKMGA